MVRSLLLKGADKDATNADGRTPLYIAAAEYDHVAAARVLLAAGADISIQPSAISALLVAAEHGSVNLLKMLVENGADVHAFHINDKSTALHLAAWNNDGEAVEVLIEAGADTEAKDSQCCTPFHGAALRLCFDAVRALLKHGADVDALDSFGGTPLLCAALAFGIVADQCGAAEMVDLLLRSGADETIVNNQGDTAADVVWDHAEYQDERLAKGAERVRNLLASAPADRAWRRRGYLVLCRAHPSRVNLPQDSIETHAGIPERHRSRRSEPAKAEEDSQSDPSAGNLVDERASWEWASVAARVLRMEEEGLFRTIVGYL